MTKVELMQKLKEARDAKNVSLHDASRVLSIRAQVLQDLEEGSFHKLGALLYVKSYTRKYATYLKIDADEIEYLLNHLEDPFKEEAVTSPIRAQLNEEKRMVHRSFFRWYLLILSALFVVGISVYFIYGEKVADIFPIKPTPERLINDNQMVKTPAVPTPSLAGMGEASQLKAITSDSVEELPVVDTRATLSEFGISQILNSGNTNIVLESQQALPNLDAEPILAAGMSSLSITLGETESWLQIKDKDSKTLMSEILPANATYHIEGEAPFALHIGNARSINKMVLNGQEVEESIYRPTTRTTVSKVILKPKEEN